MFVKEEETSSQTACISKTHKAVGGARKTDKYDSW
jgi:hypothetical protein